jgi:tetratricopeptide (TPR) repeat protein
MFDRALALLDEKAVRLLPQAAMLSVQILHEQGDFESAEVRAREVIELHPDHEGVLAAVSVLALDVDDIELARHCAAKAGGHPDALTTLGTLALGNEQAADALALFERALQRNPNSPRALVGLGLARLLTDDPTQAAQDIDRGAELFRDHLGSWIAAGWAHFVKGDLQASRKRFDAALEIDPTFAETHGSLAVLDILDGNPEAGRSRSERALRLDRNCYSAALARMLLASGKGDRVAARNIFDRAINIPVDAQGRTIAQVLARVAMK